MKGLALVMSLSCAALAQTARPAASATSEANRLGAEYFVQRAGATWTYQQGKGKGRVSIVSFLEWTSSPGSGHRHSCRQPRG